MRAAAAAATAASHRARDWREQSHADGRRRHAEYDAQSLRDHCRPRCGRQIRLPQPDCPRFGRDRPSRAWFKGTMTASDYHTSIAHFCLLGVRSNLSQCTIVGAGEPS
jgi:hypothetical protein